MQRASKASCCVQRVAKAAKGCERAGIGKPHEQLWMLHTSQRG